MSRIYLAEDDQFVSRVYERAFRLSGHEIDIRPNGEDAWKGLTEIQVAPDAIIIDIILPKMTGTELLQKISADRRFDNVPVVVLTNSFNEDIEKELKAAGADMYLLKIDHEPKDVVARVDELIQKFRNKV